jgi:hypothetical protein
LPFSSDPAFTRSWNRAEEASAYAADLANSMGLACFVVQQNRVRP